MSWIFFVVCYRQPHEGIRAVAVCGTYCLALKYTLESLKNAAELSSHRVKIKDFQKTYVYLFCIQYITLIILSV